MDGSTTSSNKRLQKIGKRPRIKSKMAVSKQFQWLPLSGVKWSVAAGATVTRAADRDPQLSVIFAVFLKQLLLLLDDYLNKAL